MGKQQLLQPWRRTTNSSRGAHSRRQLLARRGRAQQLLLSALHSCVVVWAPHILWPRLCTIKCPLCGEAAQSNGWSNNVRRVVGLNSTVWLYSARYKCECCEGLKTQTFQPTEPGEAAGTLPADGDEEVGRLWPAAPARRQPGWECPVAAAAPNLHRL